MTEARVNKHPEPTRPRRPGKAVVAAIVLLVFGFLGLGVAFLVLSEITDMSDHGQDVPGIAALLVVAQFLISGGEIVAGVFVFVGRAWARSLALTAITLNILGLVAALFTGAILQAGVGIGINALIIRLLNDDDVRDWCDR